MAGGRALRGQDFVRGVNEATARRLPPREGPLSGSGHDPGPH